MKILIVEDEKPIADLIDMSLTARGYQCTCVYDGAAAADLLVEKRFDLILLDVMLPGADRFELLEYIRPLNMPVIFLTARGAVSDRVRYAALGRDGEDARAFIGMLASDGWQARAAEGALVPAIAQGGGGDALTRAASERFSQGMTLPNAFAHTADELQSLCLDAFLRAADPVETLLRLR